MKSLNYKTVKKTVIRSPAILEIANRRSGSMVLNVTIPLPKTKDELDYATLCITFAFKDRKVYKLRKYAHGSGNC